MSPKPKVFIDGHAGTTGLRIRELLRGRDDLALLQIEESRRKDVAARARCLNDCDVAILCLPDDAAREAVALVERSGVRIIDASTAHRVAEGWTYGLPELAPGQREAVAGARRVANPGCYPTASSLLLRPLVDAGLLGAGVPITIHALSGYSGGGRSLIEKWEAKGGGLMGLPHPAPYAFGSRHKHVPEMTVHGGLSRAPFFVPAVGAYHSGMRVEIPLHTGLLGGVTAGALRQALAARYEAERFIRVAAPLAPGESDEHTFDPQSCNLTNRVVLHVLDNPDGHVLLVALLDNLGKGAAGGAVQSLNLMLGLPEDAGLSA